MNRYILQLLLFLIAFPAFAQPFRYAEPVFNKVDTLKNVEFANTEWLNSPFGLFPKYSIHYSENVTESRPIKMDIFFPHDDTLSKRPAIVFLHGGAFLLGSRYNEDMIAFCDSFARKGYVTATVDYRIGMAATISSILGIPFSIKLEDKNTYRAVYRAVQDSRAAVRFLKYKAEDFGIDTSKIFLVGSSAGAIVALQHLYWDKNEELPPDVFLSPSLGSLDAVGIQGYSSKPAGVVSLWGALQNPNVIGSDATPVLLVHGTDDEIVPFKMGVPLAGSVPDIPFVSVSMPPTFGSFCVDTALNNRGIEHDTYFVEGKRHEFYGVDTGKFGDDGPNQYWDTIQTKMTDFFLKQVQPKPVEVGSSYDVADFLMQNLTVYPNPVSRELNVGGINQPFDVCIYDLSGRRQIVKKDVPNGKIDVGELQNGIYFLHVTIGNESVVRKFIKVK